MQLIPYDIHDTFKHIGGVSYVKQNGVIYLCHATRNIWLNANPPVSRKFENWKPRLAAICRMHIGLFFRK